MLRPGSQGPLPHALQEAHIKTNTHRNVQRALILALIPALTQVLAAAETVVARQ